MINSESSPARLIAEDASTLDAQEFALDEGDLLPALEAILMVASEPVTEDALAIATGMKPEQVREGLEALRADYDGHENGRRHGFELRSSDAGWRIFSRPDLAPWVSAFVVGTDTARLTQAALETLAIVAYRQPVTRAQIARIRGVNVDGVLRTLLARNLITEGGSTASGAHMFVTTREFFDRMGLQGPDDLVPLAPFVPGPESVDEISAELEERNDEG